LTIVGPSGKPKVMGLGTKRAESLYYCKRMFIKTKIWRCMSQGYCLASEGRRGKEETHDLSKRQKHHHTGKSPFPARRTGKKVQISCFLSYKQKKTKTYKLEKKKKTSNERKRKRTVLVTLWVTIVRDVTPTTSGQGRSANRKGKGSNN